MENLEYYINKNKHTCILLPKKVSNCLLIDNYLSEYTTDSERLQVIRNLGIDESIQEILSGIDNLHTLIDSFLNPEFNFYNAGVLQNLNNAICSIPENYVKLGQVITFKTSEGWEWYQFIGNQTALNWKTLSNWKKLNFFNESQNTENISTNNIVDNNLNMTLEEINQDFKNSIEGFDDKISFSNLNPDDLELYDGKVRFANLARSYKNKGVVILRGHESLDGVPFREIYTGTIGILNGPYNENSGRAVSVVFSTFRSCFMLKVEPRLLDYGNKLYTYYPIWDEINVESNWGENSTTLLRILPSRHYLDYDGSTIIVNSNLVFIMISELYQGGIPTTYKFIDGTLRKVSVSNITNTLYQSDFTSTDTIYIFRKYFNLLGSIIKIPNGSILLFQGGSVSNGRLQGNETIWIEGYGFKYDDNYNIISMKNVFSGNFMNFGTNPPSEAIIGQTYFHKNLNKQLVFNGTEWIDNNGFKAISNNGNTLPSNLTTNDTGFIFFDKSDSCLKYWNGTSWMIIKRNVISYNDIDNFNSDILKSDSAKYTVVKGSNIIGYLDIFTDCLKHVVSLVFTTPLQIDFSTGELITDGHSEERHGQLNQFYRSRPFHYSVRNLENYQNGWTRWKILSSSLYASDEVINYLSTNDKGYNYFSTVIDKPIYWNGEKFVDALGFKAWRTVGPSSSRPTLTSSDEGFLYYDTTLHKPIFWNGLNWINSDASLVDSEQVLNKGTTSERPSLQERDAGFLYYDTIISKPIYWDKLKWRDSTGKEANYSTGTYLQRPTNLTTDDIGLYVYNDTSDNVTLKYYQDEKGHDLWVTTGPKKPFDNYSILPYTGNIIWGNPNNIHIEDNNASITGEGYWDYIEHDLVLDNPNIEVYHYKGSLTLGGEIKSIFLARPIVDGNNLYDENGYQVYYLNIYTRKWYAKWKASNDYYDSEYYLDNFTSLNDINDKIWLSPYFLNYHNSKYYRYNANTNKLLEVE